MHLLPRRWPAIVAAMTTLAAGALLPAITTARAADHSATIGAQSLLGDVLGLLDNVLTMTTAELQAALAPLSPTDIGDLLVAADPEQLTALLDALTTTQLTAALATLDPAELTSVVGVLSPDQITGLLVSTSGTASVLTGMTGTASAILAAAGTPSAAAVDALLPQVRALLEGGLPVLSGQVTTMNSLLTSVRSLVGLAGVDTALLTALLETATDTLASAPLGADTAVLEDLIDDITIMLDDVVATLPDPGVALPDPGVALPDLGVTLPDTTPAPSTTAPGTAAPPRASKPGANPRSIFDLIPSVGKFTAKLGLARASILRSDRQIDVLAPISGRASGRVKVDLFAARRHHRLTAAVDSANGRVRFKQSIPKSQAALRTGIMTIDYAGNDATRPQSVRLRAASQPAKLKLGRPTLSDGRLQASGTISRKARGVVRIEVQYLFLRQTKTLKFQAKITDGKWKLDDKLPETSLREITLRTGSVHSYTLFTGYFPERMRGEMRSYQILGDRP